MKKNLVPFDELGFRVFLVDPPFITLPDGTKAPCPNMKKLQEAAFISHRKIISVEIIDQMRGLSTKKETLELPAA